MSSTTPGATGAWFESDVPARLDRLPWSRWHARAVLALGITWILDGLEVTLVGSVASVLREPETLHLSDAQIGAAASAYLAGAIAGALVFGRLTDTLGRRRLFFITLSIYLGATLMTGLSWGFASFAFWRAITGAGIGGECAAVNSAIDELMPAYVRGRVDLVINSTYWIGTALGAASTILLLDPRFVPTFLGWRVAFVLGAALGGFVLVVRRHLPESPRWLLLHGRVDEAERVVAAIEADVARDKGPLPAPGPPVRLKAHGSIGFREIARILFRKYRRRTILGLSLMASQAFAYNAIFFTYALVLSRFYDVRAHDVGLYLLPFAASNLLGPIVLSRLFDTVGRRPMIALSYATAGILLAITGGLFGQGSLTAVSQTALWCGVFFVASAAASSAYLTVSELFPVELRGMAIAFFYAVGTAVGGLFAPLILGALIESGSRPRVALAYVFGGALFLAGAAAAAVFGIAAERKSLEEIAAM
ncbi:MAG TPA: MFS transporter [Polyangiaceae bacterium]|nr:MFS transporter [Polyangiaceae bacterium]